MALPSSGTISLSQVNVELGNSSSAAINMNSSAVRDLFEISSGAISMSDGYGKSDTFSFTIPSSITNGVLRTLALNAGWDGSEEVVATINSGVVISGNTAGNSTPALLVNGTWDGGVTLINNGSIRGRGGNGGEGGDAHKDDTRTSTVGALGGRALTVSSAISIQNLGTIGGGGGGGGGGDGHSSNNFGGGGGGGGGGRSSNVNSLGGGGGTSEGTGMQGQAGVSGTLASAGAGGSGGDNGSNTDLGADGGNGGSIGTSGSTSQPNEPDGFTRAGGGGGSAVVGNSNITWTATGTRLGGIS